MKLNLQKIIEDKLATITNEEAEIFFSRSKTYIAKLRAGNVTPDYRIAQAALDEYVEQNPSIFENTVPDQVFANPPQGNTGLEELPPIAAPTPSTITPVIEVPKVEKSKFALCMPTNRDINFTVMLSILANWKSSLPEEIRNKLAQFHGEKDTLIHHARNSIAQRFLADGAEWSVWFDSDIIAPTGNPNWFKKRIVASHKIQDKFLLESALERLTRHGRSFIGGVYAERNGSGKLLIPMGRTPGDPQGDELVAKLKSDGPQDRIIPTPWLAFGLVAVHRDVFLDIQKACPQLAPKQEKQPWAFFTPYEGGPHGEDVTFARHAITAGHQPYLDLGCFAGHVGQHAFMP